MALRGRGNPSRLSFGGCNSLRVFVLTHQQCLLVLTQIMVHRWRFPPRYSGGLDLTWFFANGDNVGLLFTARLLPLSVFSLTGKLSRTSDVITEGASG